MEYCNLGSTGIKVSNLCLGTMQFGWTANEENSFEVMDRAWDAGINFFDTANVYSGWSEKSYQGKTEEIIGRWLKTSGNRSDLILATKVRGSMGKSQNTSGLSRRHILHEIDASLKRLGTKWVDLYQSHSADETTPIKETLETYTDLVLEGKVNYIGASNYSAWRLMESLWVSNENSLASYQILQPSYSLVRRHKYEPDLNQICREYNLGVIPYSPLAGGFLTGKYKENEQLPLSDRASMIQTRFFNERGWKILNELSLVCESKGITVVQGALAWVMNQETITSPIIGANTVEQLDEILKATEVSFSPEELQRLDEISNVESNQIIN